MASSETRSDFSTPSIISPTLSPPPGSNSKLKRRASSPLQDSDSWISRKRLREDSPAEGYQNPSSESRLIEDIYQELQCGCCSELVYKPVLVLPCQHFFCGSCCALWIRNHGTNCPSCRSVSTIVTPFRALQSTIDALLRAAPQKTRTERERQQADEIYIGGNLRIPAPLEGSPEPNFSQNTEFALPCPHCLPGNPHGWQCPHPIPDPNIDPDHAWPLDDGLPPGHGHCANCESLLALQAPTTTKCDMCQAYFCGIGIQNRCVAATLLSQQPHDLNDVSDMIQTPVIYDCFENNTFEVDIMFDYLAAQSLTPKHIYCDIIKHIQSQPGGFLPLIESSLFNDVHGYSTSLNVNPDTPRNHICRLCAAEVFLWGLKDWWIRERQKGFLEESVISRKDCPAGTDCGRQKDIDHAREFNHIIAPTPTNATEVVNGDQQYSVDRVDQVFDIIRDQSSSQSFAVAAPTAANVQASLHETNNSDETMAMRC